MESNVNLFVVKIAQGSSEELLREYLGKRGRMEYVATHNFTIFVHHRYEHGRIMASEGVQHEDVLMRGRVYPDPQNRCAYIDGPGGVTLPPDKYPQPTTGTWSDYDPFTEDDGWKAREDLQLRFQSALIEALVAFLGKLQGDLTFYNHGRLIHCPDY